MADEQAKAAARAEEAKRQAAAQAERDRWSAAVDADRRRPVDQRKGHEG
jgi:hypothetical protein